MYSIFKIVSLLNEHVRDYYPLTLANVEKYYVSFVLMMFVNEIAPKVPRYMYMYTSNILELRSGTVESEIIQFIKHSITGNKCCIKENMDIRETPSMSIRDM